MSMGYCLSLGYRGDSYKGTEKQAWESFLTAVQSIRADAGQIIEEARIFDAPETCETGCCTLMRVAEFYWQDERGPLRIDHEKRQVWLHLAGGDRAIREHVARAFCRLVLYSMHRQGIELNIEVA